MMVMLLAGAAFLFQGCNKCDQTGEIEFGADKQYLAITYLVDSNGVNYNTIWRPSQVGVLFNDNGGKGQFVALQENITDGMIGPFTYTQGAPDVATMGLYHHYMYIVQKDTFGVDTFEVKFYPAVDECREYWSMIEYYRNGELLDGYEGQEIANLEIRE